MSVKVSFQKATQKKAKDKQTFFFLRKISFIGNDYLHVCREGMRLCVSMRINLSFTEDKMV